RHLRDEAARGFQRVPTAGAKARRAGRHQDAHLAQLLRERRILAAVEPRDVRPGESAGRPAQRVSRPVQQDVHGSAAHACNVKGSAWATPRWRPNQARASRATWPNDAGALLSGSAPAMIFIAQYS